MRLRAMRAGSDGGGNEGDGVDMVDEVGIGSGGEGVGIDIVHPVVLPQQPEEASPTIVDQVQEPTKRTLHAYFRQLRRVHRISYGQSFTS